MRNKTQIVLCLIVMLSACKNENNFIIPTDFSLLFPDSTQLPNGITEKEQHELMTEFISSLKANTIDHEIPDITVYNLNGQSQNLKEQLTGIRLIIASSVTCAWDIEGLAHAFPKTNKLTESPLDRSEIIVLIQKEENDYFDQQYQENLDEIKKNYSNIYLIDSLQSIELNIFGLTRYYISHEQIVVDIGIGTDSRDKYLKLEIERNTVGKNPKSEI